MTVSTSVDMQTVDIRVTLILVPVAYDYGGVVTNSRREPEYSNKTKRPTNLKDMHWLVIFYLIFFSTPLWPYLLLYL